MRGLQQLLAAGVVSVLALAGCAAPPSQSPGALPAAATTPGASGEPGPLPAPPTAPAAPPSGARMRVEFEGKRGCDAGVVCTARLSVLPDGTDLGANPSWEPSRTDPTWQSTGETVLGAPPEGDLPVLVAGAHLLVWSVSVEAIVTDGPGSPPVLATRCTSRVVVAPATTLLTLRVRFGAASTLAYGSSQCTIRAIDSGATPPPTAAPISGTATVPAALLLTTWRKVATPDLGSLRTLGWRIVLGVAPDGAFIAILSSAEQQPALVLRSADGEAWTVVGTLPDSKGSWVMSVAGNQHAIVAAGGAPDGKPGIWSSADGIAWSRLPASGADGLVSVSALAANSAGFVALGDGRGVAPWISSDPGTAWHHVGSLVTNSNAAALGIAPNGAGFVAAGWANLRPMPAAASANTYDAAVWLSDNGRSWTPASVTDAGGVTLWNVAARGSQLVALGDQRWPQQGAGVFVSSDGGRTWAHAAGPGPDSACCGLSAVADGYLATTNTVWASRDGTTWDDAAWTAAAGPATSDLRTVRVAANGTRVIAATTSATVAPAFWIGSAR